MFRNVSVTVTRAPEIAESCWSWTLPRIRPVIDWARRVPESINARTTIAAIQPRHGPAFLGNGTIRTPPLTAASWSAGITTPCLGVVNKNSMSEICDVAFLSAFVRNNRGNLGGIASKRWLVVWWSDKLTTRPWAIRFRRACLGNYHV